MKKLAIIISMLAICGFVLGCGGGSDNDCEKAAKIYQAGLDEGCAGKNDECWYCDCYNQDASVKVEVNGTEVVYSCEPYADCVDDPGTPEDECAEAACEGDILSQAQQCLNDEEACKQTAITIQTQTCSQTPK